MGSTATSHDPAQEFWLYGYGSLIWKPPPHYDQRIPGWVTGYVRRFWQVSRNEAKSISEDHRGTPQSPGRVVTLIDRSHWAQLTDHHDSAPDRVWGVAYRIRPDRVAEVKQYLDIREINGYSIHYTPFYPADGSQPIRTLVYIGTPDNEQFVGPQDPQSLAEHIRRSRGPSGWNRDYLLNLHQALAELSPESGDQHVSDLVDRLRRLEQDGSSGVEPEPVPVPEPPSLESPVPVSGPKFQQESSTTEVEEIEKLHDAI